MSAAQARKGSCLKSSLKLEAHIFTDSGPDYYNIPTDVPHKTGAQVMEEFMAKMAKKEGK